MAGKKNTTPKAPANGISKSGTTVLSPFRDENDFSKEYLPGDDVSHFDDERLEKCRELGLVGKDEEEDAGNDE